MLLKNAIQKIHVYAYDSTTGAAKTGDAANITAYVSLDGTANAIDDTNPAEVDATNMPGVYVFDLTAAETNCDSFALYAKSATSNIRIEPIIGFTTAGTSTSLSANAIAIAANAITATAIQDGAITAAKLNTGAITADAFAANAITNAAVADDVDVNVKTIAAGAITAAAIATDAIDADAIGTLLDARGITTSNKAQTGDAYARLGAPAGASVSEDIATVDGIVDTIVARVIGTLAAGTHNAQSGDSYARIGANGAGLTDITAKTSLIPASPAAVGSAMTLTSAYDAAKTAAPASTALDKTTWTDAKAGYLDAAISSRGTGTALDAAGVRSAVGLGAANLDTQLSDKTGFKLASDGLDQISATPVANPTTWAQRLNWVMQRFFYSAKTPDALVVKDANGDTLTTQALTDDAEGTETMGLPS